MQVDLQVVTLDAKRAWNASPVLRAEFNDNEAAYLAYRRAEARGAMRVLRGPVIHYGKATPDEQLTLAAPIAFKTGDLVTLSGSTRGRVAGYGAIFNSTNRKNLRILRGAFQGARVPLVMLWGHDGDKPIGRWDRLSEDERGLFAEGEINTGVAAGRDAFELLSGQDVSGLSVGFKVRKDGAKVVDNVLEISDADLLELSICAVPAEDFARITRFAKEA